MWPDGKRAAVSVSFDNLGEAAEIALGLRPLEDRTPHYSITSTLPIGRSRSPSAPTPKLLPSGSARKRSFEAPTLHSGALRP